MRTVCVAAALVRRGLQQSTTKGFDPLGKRCNHPGALLSRGYSTGGSNRASSQQGRILGRALPVWERSQTYRGIILVLGASGCLGGLVLAIADGDISPARAFTSEDPTVAPRKKLVVLGTGWGGMSFVKELDSKLYDVKIVSPRNYFVFTPLLPSVTNGTVEARSIAEPVRRMISSKGKQMEFLESECIDIDPVNKRLLCKDASHIRGQEHREFTVDYDYLVVAVGAKANTFGTEGVEEYCHFLKELEDAQKIRESVVDCFETACLPGLSDAQKKLMLSFVVVGGGPTGVEFAAELHDVIYEDLVKLYPTLMEFVSVTVIQSGDHILNTFDQRISSFAEEKFSRDGVHVQTNCRVMKVNKHDVEVKEKATGKLVNVPFGMAVWSTGIGTRPVLTKFMEKISQTDRRALATDEWLRVKGCNEVWAIGDCATMEQRKLLDDIAYLFEKADVDHSGTLSVQEFLTVMEEARERYPQIDVYMQRQHLKNVADMAEVSMYDEKHREKQLCIEEFKKSLGDVDKQMKLFPATAQVAAQQGAYLARCFNGLLDPKKKPEGPVRIRGEGRHRFQPFRYRHMGQFAPLGSEQCGAELPGDWVSVGRSTQWLWYSVYASKQVSWRTRALVMFDWTKRLVFGRDSSRM
ncbi:hypothetical protein R1sor_005010 [Riccia sorocarpa]|uniref:NADH:ubiquinone reductase (non-electrogenic) n=1 Tax=Riccia sorocarpa TaxID=122646 RepID=A0ABD3HM61_9MARC